MSHIHVLRSQTHFRWCGGRRVPFSCFALPDSFSAILRASCPIFMFCVPVHVSGGIEGVESRFHVLLSRNSYRRYRGRRVSFSCFASTDSFSAVPRSSAPVFLLCAPRLVFGVTEGVRSRFNVLRARTRFRWCGGRRVLFSCFARPDAFSVVPRASGPVLMICAPGLIFNGTEGVGSRFNVMRSYSRFRRYRGRRVPFSCFALPNLFPEVSRALGLVFMFSTPVLIFDGTEGVSSRFHVLRSQSRFRRYRGRRVPFSCFAPKLIFDGTEGVTSRFHALRSRTRFPRYRRHRFQFSCFALLDSFSAVMNASALDFMF
jgi:hypothetical protein